MIRAFTFEEGGRTYRCAVEERKSEPAGRWWWFSVSHDPQRYAPFEAVSGDTEHSVRSRIVAYYEHRLWVRAQPPAPRERFSGPGRPPNAARKGTSITTGRAAQAPKQQPKHG